MLSFPLALKHDLVQNIHHCTEWHRNQLLGSFYSTITHLCQELSLRNNLEFSLGFILTNSSWGKWFTASAEAASEEEISVRAVLWWVWHADFPARLPAWRTDSPLVCSAKPSLLQSHCSTANVVYKSWDSTAIAECAFMDPDLGFLEV